MAPSTKKTKGEVLWREAWLATPFFGIVESSAEKLVIRCDDVSAEYGEDPEVLNDGRTVFVTPGDQVSFGVVARDKQAPIAVNVWRTGERKKKEKRKKAGDVAMDSYFDAWEEEEDQGKTKNKKPSYSYRWDGRANLPEELQGDLMGVVRSQSAGSGNYWLDCEEVFAVYERDVCIVSHQMPRGIGVGDCIKFKITAPRNDNASPLAESIKKAHGDKAEGLLLKFKRMKGKGKGKGKDKGKGKGMRQAWNKETMRMLGIVKKKSVATGRHYVLCQDISDVYGVEAQIPEHELPDDVKVGDRISFDALEPEEGIKGTPLACNIRKVGTAGGKKRMPVVDDDDDGEEGEYADGEEAEIGDEVAEDEDDGEEVTVGKDELAEAEAAERLEFAAEEGDDEEVEAAPKKKKRKRTVEDPESLEGWIEMQDVIFAGEKPLKKGWIRIRSKSKGLVYYYNKETGESTGQAPLK